MYTNAKYVKNLFDQEIGIDVDLNGMSIWVPLDPANSDYKAIMALVESGELTIAPAE